MKERLGGDRSYILEIELIVGCKHMPPLLVAVKNGMSKLLAPSELCVPLFWNRQQRNIDPLSIQPYLRIVDTVTTQDAWFPFAISSGLVLTATPPHHAMQ